MSGAVVAACELAASQARAHVLWWQLMDVTLLANRLLGFALVTGDFPQADAAACQLAEAQRVLFEADDVLADEEAAA